ncbi:MAG: YraN family protein [Chloroflexi bacterium RBG_16_64_32]|nr:MAG: YraN family protein [Chloroflexi bacterium RBG_16_64_32]
MTRARRDLGAFGERVAAAHLEATGYRIRERNFRTREGEIDIIAERGETLVFVEVRTRRGDALGTAAESVTASKAARIIATAQAYAQAAENCPADQRIDVIALSLAADGRVLSLEHIEGAIDDPGSG